MTRDEFLEEITCLSDLYGFCVNNGVPVMDDIYDSDARNEYLDERCYDWPRDYTWRDVLSYLQYEEEQDGYDFYRYGDDCALEGIGEDEFGDFAMQVLEWCDSHDFWDEEEEETEEYEQPIANEEQEIDLTPIEEEDFSLCDLFAAGSQVIIAVRTEQERAADEEKENFEKFLEAI